MAFMLLVPTPSTRICQTFLWSIAQEAMADLAAATAFFTATASDIRMARTGMRSSAPKLRQVVSSVFWTMAA
jgi:hypothetical protein